jgi:hypothetical protein
MKQLGLLRWRMHIKELLYDYATDFENCEDIDTICCELKKYEKMERLSLLELAVWKTSCLSFDGSKDFRSMQDILDLWTLDETFDPVEYKRQCRYSGKLAVILRGVMTFID